MRKWLTMVPVVLLAACGGGSHNDDPDEADSSEVGVEPDELRYEAAQGPPEALLELDRLFYENEQAVSVRLTFTELDLPMKTLQVALSAPDSKDVEIVELERVAAGRYEAQSEVTVAIDGGAVTVADSVLTLAPGEPFYALHFVDRSVAPFENFNANTLTDVGFGQPARAEGDIEPEIAMSSDEFEPAVGSRPVGTFAMRGELPVQLATEELIFHAKDEDDLERFLTLTGGELKATQTVARGVTRLVDPRRASARQQVREVALPGAQPERDDTCA